jgi:pimeloyl-ACP methyl ester carboxylesterase
MPSSSRLRYIEADPPATTAATDHARAPVLVLLHAFPLSARMWEPQHALVSRGWRVVMPHLRGFDCATPDGPEVASLDDYAADVADLIETLGAQQVVVCGLSMGGYVALALYRDAPHLFRGLILANTRADADAPEARTNRLRLISVAEAGGAAAVVDDMLPRLLGATTAATQPALAERVRSLAMGNQAAGLQAAIRAMMTRPDSTSLLPTIAVPTLVITGEEDALIPADIGTRMAAAIPQALLVSIPRAGHLASLEQPRAFNAALLRFLDGL